MNEKCIICGMDILKKPFHIAILRGEEIIEHVKFVDYKGKNGTKVYSFCMTCATKIIFEIENRIEERKTGF